MFEAMTIKARDQGMVAGLSGLLRAPMYCRILPKQLKKHFLEWKSDKFSYQKNLSTFGDVAEGSLTIVLVD